MNTEALARRWAQTWTRARPAHDVASIASLHADDVEYRALAFREPDLGRSGVRRYLSENFGVEEDVECWPGEPVAAGDRAAVEWWATLGRERPTAHSRRGHRAAIRRGRPDRRSPRLLEPGRAARAALRRVVGRDLTGWA